MSMNGNPQTKCEPRSVDIDSAIGFTAGVNCSFFSKMLLTASRHFKVQDKSLSIPNAEALRRAIALMEAVLTEQVTFTRD